MSGVDELQAFSGKGVPQHVGVVLSVPDCCQIVMRYQKLMPSVVPICPVKDFTVWSNNSTVQLMAWAGISISTDVTSSVRSIHAIPLTFSFRRTAFAITLSSA